MKIEMSYVSVDLKLWQWFVQNLKENEILTFRIFQHNLTYHVMKNVQQ